MVKKTVTYMALVLLGAFGHYLLLYNGILAPPQAKESVAETVQHSVGEGGLLDEPDIFGLDPEAKGNKILPGKEVANHQGNRTPVFQQDTASSPRAETTAPAGGTDISNKITHGSPGAGPTSPAVNPEALSTSRKQNQQTDNLNVLFIGADGKRLLMTSVYSINHHQTKMKSGAIFFPNHTLLQETGYPGTLEDIFRRDGPVEIMGLLEKALEIDIAYYVRIDKAVLREVEKFIDPIYVDGEKIELENLFDMQVTPKDQEILGALMEELTKPKVYFINLPRLVAAFRKYLETDFPINPSNLVLHYRIARNVDMDHITKVVLRGTNYRWRGKIVQVVPMEILRNIVYKVTN